MTSVIPTAFLGCDVGKAEIVVFDSRSGRTRTLANTAQTRSRFAASVDETCLVICEATGGYEAKLLHALVGSARAVHRADACKVRAFIRSFGTLGKTDRIDARALAAYGLERHARLARWQPLDAERERLHRLVMLRRDLIAQRTAWSNRAGAPGAAELGPYIEPLLAGFAAQIDALDAQIRRLIDSSPPLHRDAQALRGIAGIGPQTAAARLALMPELGRLTRRKAAALAGLAPHPDQSATRDAYRRVKGGRPEIKRTLFMAALIAARHNRQLRRFHQRLLENGKKPPVAIVAVMRKLIVLANAILRDANSCSLVRP